MGSFSNNDVIDTRDSVENDGSMATVNVVKGRVSHGSGNGKAKTQLSNSGKKLCHDSVTEFKMRKERRLVMLIVFVFTKDAMFVALF